MDYNFYKFQGQFSEKLENCQGQLEWSSVKGFFQNIEDYGKFEEGLWKITSVSLIYPRSQNVKAILLNDSCVHECRESHENIEASLEKCERFCDSMSFDMPARLFSNSVDSRFFDFEPLIENISKNLSVCRE